MRSIPTCCTYPMTLAEDQERIFTSHSDWRNHGPIYLCVVKHCDYSTYPRGRQYELTVDQRNERASNQKETT